MTLNSDQAGMWAQLTAEKFHQKISAVRERSKNKIPARAIQGVHDDKSDATPYPFDDGLCWWTNGFWAGMLWQLYSDNHDKTYANIAQITEEKLDKCFETFLGLHHDVGFMWLPSAVAHYRVTKNEEARRRGLHAANLLAGRFNPCGYIRAWNDIPASTQDTRGWAIIDCMFNIPLLYWATEETGDPRFAQIAQIHAATVQNNFIRPNGSVRHIVEFNPQTGAFVQEHGGQGIAQGSSWTRGQTWALYGFVMSYRHTKNESYLQTAQKVADRFVEYIPDSGRIPVDFDQPKDVDWYDDIAAAIAACGLIELSRLVPQKKEYYFNAALKLLQVLDNTADWSSETDGVLQNCSAAYHCAEHNVNYTYGDYFFLEAVLKIKKTELYLW